MLPMQGRDQERPAQLLKGHEGAKSRSQTILIFVFRVFVANQAARI